MVWTVKMTAKAEREFKSLLEKGLLDTNDCHVIRLWLNEIEELGPAHIAKSVLWNDHPLDGDWRGFRASCFSYSGRIIYQIRNKEIIVEVHRVTADHNYKK